MNTLDLEFQFLLSKARSISFNSNCKMGIPLYNSCSLLKPTFSLSPSNLPLINHNLLPSFSVCNQTQIQNVITCARNSKRRTGYQRPPEWVLKSLCFVALNLKILPEPLALAITALAGGNGGGIGFPKGFGVGDFDGWRSRRRKGKNKLGFLGFVMFFGVGMWLVLGKEIDSDVFFGVVVLSLLGVSIKGWKRGFRDWVLGFCFCASLVGLGFRREKLHIFFDLEKFHTFFGIEKLQTLIDVKKLQSLVKDFAAMETLLRRK